MRHLPHHFHIRRRLEPYPSRRAWIRLLDATVYVVGIAGPLASIPQIVKIYGTHNATGVSVISFSIFALFDIPWILYAAMHEERPLIYCYSLWLLFNVLIALGAFLYGTGL